MSAEAVLDLNRPQSASSHPPPALRLKVFEPSSSVAARDPIKWAADHVDELRGAARSAGAALLRGFDIVHADQFAAIATLIGGALGHGYQGPSPRTRLTPGVYTASEVPSALVIPEHAEMSYLRRMARHLFFWCKTPASHGGATTLVDGRALLERLDGARIAPLLEVGLRIRRRHAPPEGLRDPFELKPWPEAFATKERAEAVARAQELGFAARFESSGALTLESTQAAVRVHPESGEHAWLNHLLVFHASTPAALLASAHRRERAFRAAAAYPLAALYRRACDRLGIDVASDVTLADGTPIADAVVDHIREVVDREALHLSWRRGDVAILDNHVVLHGRRPFRGTREVAVAFSAASA